MRRRKEEIMEVVLKWLSENSRPHSIVDVSKATGVDYLTVKRLYRLMELVAKYKVVPVRVEGLDGFYVARKVGVEEAKVV